MPSNSDTYFRIIVKHYFRGCEQLFEMPEMYAGIFAAGALGYGLNLL